MGIKKSSLPHEATLFHRDGESYTAFYFKYVRFEQRIAVMQKTRGQASYDTFKVFIDPKNSVVFGDSGRKKYLPCHTYKHLAEPEKNEYWTIEEGDYLAAEHVDAGLWADIRELKKKMRVYTVNSFVPVYEKRGLHHWEVSGRGKILE